MLKEKMTALYNSSISWRIQKYSLQDQSWIAFFIVNYNFLEKLVHQKTYTYLFIFVSMLFATFLLLKETLNWSLYLQVDINPLHPKKVLGTGDPEFENKKNGDERGPARNFRIWFLFLICVVGFLEFVFLPLGVHQRILEDCFLWVPL